VRLRAIGDHVPQLMQLGVAALFHQLRDAVAPAQAARLASIDMVGVRKSESVWAFSLMPRGRPMLFLLG
jgi:hypothetical protein